MAEVNTNVLKDAIDESGMSITAICDKANITRATFYNKLNGKSEWTLNEITSLCDVLHLTQTQLRKIFFA